MKWQSRYELGVALLWGGRCIMPTTRESQRAVLLIWMRHLRFALAYVAAVKAAGVVFSHRRFGFGSGGYTGRQFFLSPPPFDKDEIRTGPWRGSKAFSVYGVPPSTGETLFSRTFSPEHCLSALGRIPDPADPFESSSQGVTITIFRCCQKPRNSVG